MKSYEDRRKYEPLVDKMKSIRNRTLIVDMLCKEVENDNLTDELIPTPIEDMFEDMQEVVDEWAVLKSN